jgi:hypothetical protein
MTQRLKNRLNDARSIFGAIDCLMQDWDVLDESQVSKLQAYIYTLSHSACMLQAVVSEEVGRGKGFKR